MLTEVIGRIQETNGTNSSLVFSSAKASFEQSLYSEENPYKLWNAASVIDGDVKGTSFGWASGFLRRAM